MITLTAILEDCKKRQLDMLAEAEKAFEWFRDQFEVNQFGALTRSISVYERCAGKMVADSILSMFCTFEGVFYPDDAGKLRFLYALINNAENEVLLRASPSYKQQTPNIQSPLDTLMLEFTREAYARELGFLKGALRRYSAHNMEPV
jgi:hypothetical protein